MSGYVYAPYIDTRKPIPPVAHLIKHHDALGTFGKLPWYTDRDTLTEHLKYNNIPKDELLRIIGEKPSNVSHRALVEAAAYVSYLCDMLELDEPSWVYDDDTMVSLRAPMFGKQTRQRSMRRFIERSGGISSPLVKRGVFREPKDYGVI